MSMMSGSGYFGKEVVIEDLDSHGSGAAGIRKTVVGTGSGGVSLDKDVYGNAAGGISLWQAGRESIFMTWKVQNDTITLREEGFTSRCVSSAKQYVFPNESILPQVFVREFDCNIVILLATNKSVHRLLLKKLENSNRRLSRLPSGYLTNEGSEVHSYSFMEKLSGTGAGSKVLSAAFWHHSSLKSSFVISCEGDVLVKVLMEKDGKASMTTKYYGNSGLLNMFSKKANQTLHSVVIANAMNNHYIFGVDRLSKLHIVSLMGLNQVYEVDLAEFVMEESGLMVPQVKCCNRIKIKTESGSGAAVSEEAIVYLQYEYLRVFLIIRLSAENGPNFSCTPLRAIKCELSPTTADENLVDFCFDSESIYALWTNPGSGTHSIRRFDYVSFDASSSKWMKVLSSSTPHDSLPMVEDDQDPSAVYVNYVMSCGMFSTAALLAVTIQMRERQNEQSVDDMELAKTRLQLKQLIVDSVESEVQSNLPQYDPENEEHRKTLIEHWQLFYSMLCEHNCAERNKVVGLLYNVPKSFIGTVSQDQLAYVMPISPFEIPASEILAEVMRDHCNAEVTDTSAFNVTSESTARFSKLIEFFEKMSTECDVQNFLKVNCLMNENGLKIRQVVKNCFDSFEEVLTPCDKKLLRRMLNHADTESLCKILPLLMEFLTDVLTSSLMEDHVGSSLINTSLDASSAPMNFVASKKILRTLISQNCGVVINNTLSMLCPIAMALACLSKEYSYLPIVTRSFLTVCKYLHSWLFLHWLHETEIHDVETANETLSRAVGTSSRNEITTPTVNPHHLFSGVDDTIFMGKGALELDERSHVPSKSPAPSVFGGTESKLTKVTFLSDFVEANSDIILSSLLEFKNAGSKTLDETQIVQEVSVKLLDQLNVSTNASALSAIAKHLLLKDTASSMVETQPKLVLDMSNFLELSLTSGQEASKGLIHYLKMLSYHTLGETEEALEIGKRLLVNDEIGLAMLIRLKNMATEIDVKMHVLTVFEQSKSFAACLELIQIISDCPDLNKGDKLSLSMIKFNCLWEVNLLADCYDSLCDIWKYVQRLPESSRDFDRFKDCLKCWVQAICETHVESSEKAKEVEKVELSEFSCVLFCDELIAVLEQKARLSSPLCPVPFYNCLKKFYTNRNMCRTAAIVMLEKAVRIQAELHASAGATEEERLQLGKLIHKEEYKAWQDSEMCLMLCEEKDQMVLMPKFTKAHNASEDEQEQHGGVTVLKLKDISQYRMVASIQHKLLSLDNRQLDSEVILNGRTMSKEDLMVKAAEYGLFNDAMRFGQTCKLDLSPVFQKMTDFYCDYYRTSSNNEHVNCANHWLQQNSLPEEAYLTMEEHFKLMFLLKDHLERASDDIVQTKKYYFVVLTSQLNKRSIVFTWLLQKIKEWKEDWQLAKLYLKHGYLFLSCQVSCSLLESELESIEEESYEERLEPYQKSPRVMFADTKLYRAQLSVLANMKRKGESAKLRKEAIEWHNKLNMMYSQYVEKLVDSRKQMQASA